MRRAVYVAGRGAVSGFGLGREALVDGVFAGCTALRARVRTARFRAPTAVAAEFPEGSFTDLDEVSLPTQAGIAAGAEALAEADVSSRATGLVLATTKAELSGFGCEGTGFALPIRLAHRIADGLGLGPVHGAVSSACASGVSALAMAVRRIATGDVDRVLVVGTDALNEFIMAGFGAMHILDPEPCRPFDVARRGISLGDGAGAILLSAHASESVGVRVVGHAGANDAHHVTGCDRNGEGMTLAATRALAHAGLDKSEIDFIHLHGTGTRANDFSESCGLGNIFGDRTPPAFGTKAQTGHTLGAAGIIESLLVIAALEHSRVPANVGLTETDVDGRLDLTRSPRRLPRARRGLKVSSGFGGVQHAMVFAS